MTNVVSLVPRGCRPQLRDAQQQRQLVRVWRDPVEPGSYAGYVLGVGTEFFLLWGLDDDLRPSGLMILRHQDISHVDAPDVHADFMEKALTLQGLAPPSSLEFELDDLGGVLRSCQRFSPVVTLLVPDDEHDEPEFPIVLYVGQLTDVGEDLILVQEISPDGQWEAETSGFVWNEIQGVIIQDNYARLLYAVAEQNRLANVPDNATPRLKLAPPRDTAP